MIKDGMWFENKEHYEYYLSKAQPALDAISKLQEVILSPLIIKAQELS